jgi:hypothetical protein
LVDTPPQPSNPVPEDAMYKPQPAPARMIPLDRFRAIMAELHPERESWTDAYWLRYAAQAVVLCPGEPSEIANRLRTVAAELSHRGTSFKGLHSSLRFVVAAMLLQANTEVPVFLADVKRIIDMLDEVGLRRSGNHQLLTAIILRMAPDHDAFSMFEAERLKAIYQQMKSFHWWLTGPHDLPACAALAQVPGSAEVVVGRAEAIYQRLVGADLTPGNSLQNAANLLPLMGFDQEAAADRYLVLVRYLQESTDNLQPEHYDAVALLTLLEQPPDLVVAHLEAVRKELDLYQPYLAGASSFAVAADLTVLDLLRRDMRMQPFTSTADLTTMLSRLHVFHIASAVQVSQARMSLDLDAAEVPPIAWAYPYPYPYL